MELLQVNGNQIVDAKGQPVRLRGTCVGGWMNMENFIAGYPGAEHGLRAAMAEVLGPAKAQFFFDRLLDYFLAEEDLAFIKSCGSTVVRLSLNYRHFERDDRPFEYLEEGFSRLDRALGWCQKLGLYALLDLHSVQGWQNPDWHSDNANRTALFWSHTQFQDRFVALWEEFARRYAGNATVAGYNVMNEPVTRSERGLYPSEYKSDWGVINRVYHRVVTAIRAIDPKHIVFLEGDLFPSRFDGLDAPFADNLVYGSHNYTTAGFGPGAYPGNFGGETWDRQKQRQFFLERQGTQFAQRYNVPLWVGEFGSVFNGPEREYGDRFRALDDQIGIFEEFGAHWTTWTYKDVGIMGWVEVDPGSEFMQLMAPMLEAKRRLDTDYWMGWLPSNPVKEAVAGLARQIEQTLEDLDLDPGIQPEAHRRVLNQAALDNYTGGLLQPIFARRFLGMPEESIDRVLQSFAFQNCRINQRLVGIIKKYTGQ